MRQFGRLGTRMAHKEKESVSAIIESLLRGLVESIFAEMLEKCGPSHVPKPDAVMEEVNKRFLSLLGPPKQRDGSANRIELLRLPNYGNNIVDSPALIC